jgi:nucleotide-binding universal stress UspA family protein
MTKTIVVALDGSPEAERAVPVAGGLADRLGADLHLMTTSFEADPAEDQAYLDEQAAGCARDDVETSVLQFVLPAPGIIEAVDALPDAVLCMSTHGRNRLSELLLGSVADEVLRETTSPVVVVGPRCEPKPPAGAAAVVCLDGSHGSTAVLPIVAEWADQLGLRVHLLTVEPHGVLDDPAHTWGQELLQGAAAHFERLGVPTEQHAVESSHPGDVVVAFVAALDASFVALGTRGTGLSPSAIGGVASHVIRHCPAPVLVHR